MLFVKAGILMDSGLCYPPDLRGFYSKLTEGEMPPKSFSSMVKLRAR